MKVRTILTSIIFIMSLFLMSCRTDNNLKYELNETKDAYTVVGIGGCKDSEVTILAEYKNLPVTSIGSYAFRNCQTIENVEIPSSVTSIGDGAFAYCPKLKSVEIPESVKNIGVEVFFGCIGLTDVEISCNMTKIEKATFSLCTSLKNINIPTSVLSIEESAFYNCSSLENIEIPASVKTIGNYAFENCKVLTNIEIPASVESIGYAAFAGCIGATNVEVSNENEKYDSREDCNAIIETATNTIISGFKNTSFPSSVTTIGEGAFFNCSVLKSIEIPTSITSISYNAFGSCSSLESIKLSFVGENKDGSGATHFGYIFGAKKYEDNSLYVPAKLKEVDLVNATSIAQYAFYDCKSVTNMKLSFVGEKKDGSGATHFGYIFGASKADENNKFIPSSLKEVNLVNCESIAQYAFYKCDSISKMTLSFVGEKKDGSGATHFGYIFGASTYEDNGSYVPSSLKEVNLVNCESIAQYAFYKCDSISKMTLSFVGENKDGSGATHFGYIFGASTYEENDEYVPAKLKEVDLVNVTNITQYAFYDCKYLTSVVIPTSVESIEKSAFEGCTSLASITIPTSVTSMGTKVFEGCSNLIIYCQAGEQPEGWDSNWNSNDNIVEWGYVEK